MNYFLRMMVIALCCMVFFTDIAAANDKEAVYEFAVVPQMTAIDINKSWTPFLKALSSKMRVTFKLRVHASIPIFEEALLKGEPDFAYMNPYHAVMAMKAQGYVPFIRGKKELTGILITNKNKGAKNISDLNGKMLVFPSPNAFAASLYMRALLSEKEKIHFATKYVKTHQNVYKSVALNMAAAGGGIRKTFEKEDPSVKNKLVEIYKTPGTASHPIAAHNRIPAEFIQEVQTAILQLANDPKNREMFHDIQIAEPIQADYKKDYLPLQRLGLDTFVETGKEVN